MGYIYTGDGKLVCDRCNNHPSRKRPCPSGWCSSASLCTKCYQDVKANGQWKKAHTKCASRQAECKTEQEKAQVRLDAGEYLRYAALNEIPGMVRVLFQNKNNTTIGFSMASETYNAFPLLTDVSPEQYAEHGTLIPAPNHFDDLGGK